jgi:hypothetical protein
LAYSEYFQSNEFHDLLHHYEEAGLEHLVDFSSGDLTDLAEYFHTIGDMNQALKIVDAAIDIYPGAVGPLVFRARTSLVKDGNPKLASYYADLIDDKTDLEKLSDAKDMGGQLIKGAALAVVVLGDPLQNDCWVEDGSIAAISMQYQAEELGLGSCWVQMRGRGLADGTSADTVIQGILDIPENLSCLCVLAIGHWADERKPQAEDRLKWENVHVDKF